MLLVCDGGKKGDIVYGSYKLFTNLGKLLHHKQVVFGFGTSNSAEYLILITALNDSIRFGYKDIFIQMDSQLVVNQVNRIWRCKTPHLKSLRDQVFILKQKFTNFEITHVTRNIIQMHLGH